MSDFEFSRTLYGRVVEENKQLKEENEELRNDMKLFVVDELCEVLYRLKNKDIFLEDYLDKEIRELRSNKADSRVYFLPGRFSGKSAVTRFFKSLLDEKDKKIEELEAEIVRLRCQQNEQDQKIKDLEAKLAESENKVKGFVELFDKKQHENYEQFCEIMQLKQQLAEKDELLRQKIEKMKSTDFIKMCKECGFMVQAKENDNQTAIAELEKVKKFLLEKIEEKQSCFDSGNYNDFADGVKTICEIMLISIDKQIKSLKGEK